MKGKLFTILLGLVFLATINGSAVASSKQKALSAVAGTGYISISPTAFHPTSGNFTGYLIGFELTSGNIPGNFVAPLQLPNNAIVTKITCRWKDNSDVNNVLLLIRSNFISENTEATLESSGASEIPYFSSITTSITIDNSQYAYYFYLQTADGGQKASFYGAIIEYTYSTDLPLVTNNSP